MKLHIGSLLVATVMLGGCSAYNSEPKSIVLPSSNKSIDLVQHRSDVRFSDCGTLLVLQTYSATGSLIDSKEARGSALHCVVIPALIEAGGDVGAGYVGRAVNVLSNVQSQGQKQGQTSSNTNTNTSTAVGGAGGAGGNGGNGGNGGGHGNNGGGNGDGDGTNPGTDHHHDNGDNS